MRRDRLSVRPEGAQRAPSLPVQESRCLRVEFAAQPAVELLRQLWVPAEECLCKLALLKPLWAEARLEPRHGWPRSTVDSTTRALSLPVPASAAWLGESPQAVEQPCVPPEQRARSVGQERVQGR